MFSIAVYQAQAASTSTANIDYSEAERRLISKLSNHWINVIDKTSITPHRLYEILATEVFIENKQGPEIEALRKVMKACLDCKPYRMTPEFDELCQF